MGGVGPMILISMLAQVSVGGKHKTANNTDKTASQYAGQYFGGKSGLMA